MTIVFQIKHQSSPFTTYHLLSNSPLLDLPINQGDKEQTNKMVDKSD
jgi:hypothetical protein